MCIFLEYYTYCLHENYSSKGECNNSSKRDGRYCARLLNVVFGMYKIVMYYIHSRLCCSKVKLPCRRKMQDRRSREDYSRVEIDARRSKRYGIRPEPETRALRYTSRRQALRL